MSEEDRQILEEFAARVRERHPEADVVAFGSRARGDARWDSDLDLLVVLDHPADRRVKGEIRDLAWEVGYEHDRLLCVLVYERTQLEEGPLSASPLFANIQREGVPA